MEVKKIKVVKDWLELKSIRDIQTFCRLCLLLSAIRLKF